MSIFFKRPKKEELENRAKVFSILQLERQLLTGGGETIHSPSISFERLYAYVCDHTNHDPELSEAIQKNPKVLIDFRTLLKRTSTCYTPRAAAASSQKIRSREGNGCCIFFEESKAEPNQTFIVIEFYDKKKEPPRQIFVINEKQKGLKKSLPKARDGVVQFLLENNSDLFKGLTNINSEIFFK